MKRPLKTAISTQTALILCIIKVFIVEKSELTHRLNDIYGRFVNTKKSASALISPDRQMFFGKKSRSLTFIAEGYLTRGARRWSWTIHKVEFYAFL